MASYSNPYEELIRVQRALRAVGRGAEVGPMTRRYMAAPDAQAMAAVLREYLPSEDWAGRLLNDVMAEPRFPREPTPIDSDR